MSGLLNCIYKKDEDMIISSSDVLSKGTELYIQDLVKYLKENSEILSKCDICYGDILEVGLPLNGLLEVSLVSSYIPLYNGQYSIDCVIEETEELEEFENLFNELDNLGAIKLVIKFVDKPSRSILYQSQVSQNYYVVYMLKTDNSIVEDWKNVVNFLNDEGSKEEETDSSLGVEKNIEQLKKVVEIIETKEDDKYTEEPSGEIEESREIESTDELEEPKGNSGELNENVEIPEVEATPEEEVKEEVNAEEGVKEEESVKAGEPAETSDKEPIEEPVEEPEEVEEELNLMYDDSDLGYADTYTEEEVEEEHISKDIILPANISSYLIKEFTKLHSKIFGLIDLEKIVVYIEAYKEGDVYVVQVGYGDSYINLEFSYGLNLISYLADGLQYTLNINKVSEVVANFLDKTFKLLKGLENLDISIDSKNWNRGIVLRNASVRKNFSTDGFEVEII